MTTATRRCTTHDPKPKDHPLTTTTKTKPRTKPKPKPSDDGAMTCPKCKEPLEDGPVDACYCGTGQCPECCGCEYE